jgi:serine/threonine protein phosphatase PrpC
VQAGLLSEENAIYHADRYLVSNLLGSRDARIEIGPCVEMRTRDTLLVATDGLFDNLHIREIVDIIRTGRLERITTTLAAKSLRRMRNPGPGRPSKPDDLTFILFRLNRFVGA